MNAAKLNASRWAATVAISGAAVFFATSREFYQSSIISPYLSWALFSAFVVMVLVRRSWSDAAIAAAASCWFAIVDFAILRFPTAYASVNLHAGAAQYISPAPFLSFLGLSSLAVLAARVVWAESKEQRQVLLCAAVPLVLFAAADWSATALLDLTGRLHPKTFDLYLYSFDCSLRIQPSFAVGRLFLQWPWLSVISCLFYIALPVTLGIVYGARLRQEGRRAVPVAVAFVITGPLGILFYNMLPAAGPVHVFRQNFPLHAPAIADVARVVLGTVPIGGARNAIPSLHMAWVLLAWWNSKRMAAWVRAVALVFVIFTVLATLGTGEHYLVDLVVAFPFAMMVDGLARYDIPFSSAKRKLPIMAGLLTTITWFALLTYATAVFWMSPVIPWLMIVTTFGRCWWLTSAKIAERKVVAGSAAMATSAQ